MRAAVVLLAGLAAGLALAAGAHAAPPLVTASAVPATGDAPLRVTLTAAGDAASYAWDLGDGTSAAGASVVHVYGPGRFVATVTATGATGETAQAQVQVSSVQRTLSLTAPRAGDFGGRVELRGVLRPAVRGGMVQIYRGRTYVTSGRVAANGRFRARIRLGSPGPYEARYAGTRSRRRAILVRPLLHATVARTAPVGGPLAVSVGLVPAVAGKVRVEVRRGPRVVATRADSGSLRLPTGVPGTLRIRVTSRARRGYAPAQRLLSVEVVLPSLSLGSRGESVRALERRLAELRYAIRGVDGLYGFDTYEAVTAFQKVNGLARTGRVDASLWRRLAVATVPRPRYAGADHIEVDKTRQVLLEVTGGLVTRVVHVSTGATGNTPVGTWHVYRKVTGFDWVLWYPMYFLRGFAIHGYPSVPAYPASHGCVRVPMWIAPILFAAHPYGATVTVYA